MGTNDSAASITSAAFNGISLVRIRRDPSSDTTDVLETWYLTNPSSGTANLVMNIAGPKLVHAGVLSYQGVDQTNPIGATTFTTGTSSTTNPSITLVTTSSLSEILSLVNLNASDTITPGLGQNQRWVFTTNDSTQGDDKLTTTAGSYPMTYTLSTPDKVAIQAIELIAFGLPTSTATNTPTKTATQTPTTTVTNTPTRTATQTPTATPTNTPINTNTPTNTPTITSTPTITGTPTQTPIPTSSVWPNPFTPTLSSDSWTHFNIPASHGSGEFIILNLRQHPIRTLKFNAGVPVGWDGKTDSGQIVPSGVYLYLLKVDGIIRRGSIAVLR